jgi:hypothetical protein
LRKTPAIPPDLNTQVFTARFAKRPKQIDVVRLPVRITKTPVGEAVGFGNTLHDFLRSRDDVSRGEEPRCGSPPLASKANDRFWRKAVGPVRPDLGLRSRRQLRTRVSSDHLRRLSEGAQEGAAHAVAIGKTRPILGGLDPQYVQI